MDRTLEERLADAQQGLNQLRDASAEAWSQAEENLQQAMTNLQEGYQQAVAAFDEATEGEPEPEADD